MIYDHTSHVGNAGDVWKHLILTEAAHHLLILDPHLLYAESHTGWREYSLPLVGEWKGGVGRLWPPAPELLQFPYFRILSRMNPEGLLRYPGSSQLVLNVAQELGVSLQAELWDINPLLQRAWSQDFSPHLVSFHLGDGFGGVERLVEVSDPGLLLIDSPYTGQEDVEDSEDLFYKAATAGWTVLCWYMLDLDKTPRFRCPHQIHCLEFRRAGMDGGRWKGAGVAVASEDDQLSDWLAGRTETFLLLCRSKIEHRKGKGAVAKGMNE
ncbi:MAG: 23S rRNA (adenine(2030)-N(6))-methyltransferase RlmJ [Methanosarcinales archaeon]|nr:23S rRNA (adenine(2030)-N(6))-methyltransferase RlmJ [Methanosarcinales archaeon]